MKTLEDIMYISNGHDPFHHIRGRGGLFYKPYLPISGGMIGEEEIPKEEGEEVIVEENEKADEPEEEDDVVEQEIEQEDTIDNKLDGFENMVRNEKLISNKKLSELLEQLEYQQSDAIDTINKKEAYRVQLQKLSEMLKKPMPEKLKEDILKKEEDINAKYRELEEIGNKYQKRAQQLTFIVNANNQKITELRLGNVLRNLKNLLEFDVLTEKELKNFTKKIKGINLKDDDAEEKVFKIDKELTKLVEPRAKEKGFNTVSLSHLNPEKMEERIKKGEENNKKAKMEREQMFKENAEKLMSELTLEENKKKEKALKEKEKKKNKKVGKMTEEIIEEKTPEEKIERGQELVKKDKLKKAFERWKNDKNEFYTKQEGRDYLHKLVDDEYEKRIREGQPPDKLKKGKIYEDILAKELSRDNPTLKTSDIPYYKNIPYENLETGEKETLADYLPYDIIGKDVVIENKYYSGKDGISFREMVDNGINIPLQISKFGGYSEKNAYKFLPFFTEENGKFKLYGIYDNSNKKRWMEHINNQDLHASFLLQDGVYNVKMNNPEIFKMKPSTKEGLSGEKLYQYDLNDIKQKFNYDPKTKAIYLPPNILTRQRVRKSKEVPTGKLKGKGLTKGNSENYDKIIDKVDKYYYFVISPKKTILLSSSNDVNKAKKDALDKLEPQINKFINKKLVFVQIMNTYDKYKNKNDLKLVAGPIAFELMSGLIESKDKIKNEKETGNNKHYLSKEYIKNNINDITTDIKKVVKKYSDSLTDKTFIDVNVL